MDGHLNPNTNSVIYQGTPELALLFQGESIAGPPGDKENPDSAMLDMESMRAVPRRPGVPKDFGESWSLCVSLGPGERLPKGMDKERAAAPRGGDSSATGEESACPLDLSKCRCRESNRTKRLIGTGTLLSSALERRKQHMYTPSTHTRQDCRATAQTSQGMKPTFP